jgi:hypothetical protein
MDGSGQANALRAQGLRATLVLTTGCEIVSVGVSAWSGPGRARFAPQGAAPDNSEHKDAKSVLDQTGRYLFGPERFGAKVFGCRQEK